jgi:hypothetical protein
MAYPQTTIQEKLKAAWAAARSDLNIGHVNQILIYINNGLTEHRNQVPNAPIPYLELAFNVEDNRKFPFLHTRAKVVPIVDLTCEHAEHILSNAATPETLEGTLRQITGQLVSSTPSHRRDTVHDVIDKARARVYHHNPVKRAITAYQNLGKPTSAY